MKVRHKAAQVKSSFKSLMDLELNPQMYKIKRTSNFFLLHRGDQQLTFLLFNRFLVGPSLIVKVRRFKDWGLTIHENEKAETDAYKHHTN